MYWQGSEILLTKFPLLRKDIKAIDRYFQQRNYQAGTIFELRTAAALTGVSESELKVILDKGVEIGMLNPIFKLECVNRRGTCYKQNTPFSFPLTLPCDQCDEDHEFMENDVIVSYQLNMDIAKGSDLEEVPQPPIDCNISKGETSSIRKEMHVMRWVSQSRSYFRKNEQFKNTTFLVVLHFLKDLLYFLEVCTQFGLQPENTYLFYKPYFYPDRERIVSCLKEKNYQVFRLDQYQDVLDSLKARSVKPIIILEDGGYLVQSLHEERFQALVSNTLGAVEQTTQGIRKDKEIDLAIPVLNVAECKPKTEIEPRYVADAVVRNLQNLLTGKQLIGKRIGLLGFGNIGQAIAEALSNKMNVSVFDPDPLRQQSARDRTFNVERNSIDLVKDKYMVIGCSGVTSIGRDEILNLKNGTYLVSATSDRREIGFEELESLSTEVTRWIVDNKAIGTIYSIQDNEIRLVADGYPINFWFSESMPNTISDVILSIILASALSIAQNGGKYAPGIHDVDSIITESEVFKVFNSFQGRG
jgi:adenosylhomocysteinase